MARREMDIEEARSHVGATLERVPDDIREEIKDALPHYMWIAFDECDRRRRWLWCEWCETLREERKKGKSWPSDFTHNETTTCPWCGRMVIPKHMGRGYSKVRDKLEVVWYQKSAADPEMIVALGAYCERDFSYADTLRPWTLEASVEIRSFAVIGRGDGWRFKHKPTDWTLNGVWRPTRFEWVAVKKPGALTFGDTSFGFIPYTRPARLLLTHTLESAIEGTAFERAWDEDYLLTDRRQDGVEALTMIARYPCIEYMTKLGLQDFLVERLDGGLPAGTVNWRGKSMAQVLRLSRQRLGELKHAGIKPTPALVALLHWLDGEGLKLTAGAAWNVAVLAERSTITQGVPGAVARALNYHQPSRRLKALKYINRQAEKNGGTRLHLGDFTDYWRQCREYGENLNDDMTAFPANLQAAEQRFVERRRREEEAKNAEMAARQDAEIAKRLKSLEKRYAFSFGGLSLRPARSGAEVRAEGKALHHCVGGYVDRYARGETVICVLRRDIDPDRPWRTVEISKAGRLVQDRGYRNDAAGAGVPLSEAYKAALKVFWDAWEHRHDDESERRAS